MTMGVQTVLTDEQFLSLPESPCKQELLDGRLIELPPAKRLHSRVTKRISHLLEATLGEEHVWIETAYKLRSGRWLIPDVSVTWPEQGGDEWFQGSPMIAVEIVSRGNTAADLDEEVAAYLEEGAAEVWVIYPPTHAMMVFRRDSALRIDGATDYHCELINVTVTPEYRTAA